LWSRLWREPLQRGRRQWEAHAGSFRISDQDVPGRLVRVGRFAGVACGYPLGVVVAVA
jgi:hypothetical protein